MQKPIALLALLTLTSTLLATTVAPFTELQPPDLGEANGDPLKPTVITSTEELEKAISDADTRAAIAKQIDFKQSKLLWFHWRGSGGDSLTAKAHPDDRKEHTTVTFTLHRGRTRDLRHHHKLYAIPTTLQWQTRQAP